MIGQNMECKDTILIVGPLPPPMGGIATYVDDMLKSNIVDEYNVLHLNTARKHSIKKSLVKNFILFSKNLLKLLHLLAFKRPKIVHIHTSSYLAFWEKSVFIIISKLFNTKVVLHIHGAEFDQFYMNSCGINKHLIKSILKLPDTVIVLSMHWRQFFLQLLNDEKISVIPNGVNVSQIKAHKGDRSIENNRTDLKVIFLGNLVERKGVYDILSAIPLILDKYTNIHFILAGSEEQSGEIERIKDGCINRGINNHITFKSGFSNDEKNELLFESDIYLLPSYAEGLPISLLEAMAAGLPIISTPVGGIPEVIVEGENGHLITPGDHVDLANKIIELVEKPELRIKMGQNNEKKIRDEYDWNIISDKLKNEYNVLLLQ